MFLNPVVTVTKDPSDVTLKQGAGSANLSVTASVSGGSGKDEFSYRWQKSSDGVNFTDIEDRLDYRKYQRNVYEICFREFIYHRNR